MPTLRSHTLATTPSHGDDADRSYASSKSPSSPAAHASDSISGAVPESLLDPVTSAVKDREHSLRPASKVQLLHRSTRRQASAISDDGKRKSLEKKLEFTDDELEVVEPPKRRRRGIPRVVAVGGTETETIAECTVVETVIEGKKKVEEGIWKPVVHQLEIPKFAKTVIKSTSKAGEVSRELEPGYRLKMDKGKRKVEELILVSDDDDDMLIDEKDPGKNINDFLDVNGEGQSSGDVGNGEGSWGGVGPQGLSIDVDGDGKAEMLLADLEDGGNAAKKVYGRRRPKGVKKSPKTRFLEIARRRAAHFAHFPQFDGEEAVPVGLTGAADTTVPLVPAVAEALNRSLEVQRNRVTELLARVAAGPEHREVEEAGNWPGPFSTGRQLVEARRAAAAARLENAFVTSAKESPQVEWEPTRPANFRRAVRLVPSLYDLSMDVLCANIEHVVDLNGIEEADKKSILVRLCAMRKMSPAMLSLYFQSKPTDVRIPDCSYILEDNLIEALREGTENLEALELGMCGRCLSDKLCSTIWGQKFVTMPMLHTLSLKGAYCITDMGLNILAKASPALTKLNLIKCNMISPSSIQSIADSVGPNLDTFHLCDCSQLDASRVLPSLLKMTSLQSLSLSGVGGLTDDIMIQLVDALGPGLHELSVADCKALSDTAVCAISLNCPELKLLDLSCIPNLTDAAIAVLTENCGSLKTLKLDRGKFSEKAVSSFVTSCGSVLTELSLNSVRQTGDITLGALAKFSKVTLKKLDLSFCRAVTDKGLGLLADSCTGLQELRLFGCTQVTAKFLEGHSNPVLDVIGLDRILKQRR